jgi:hypothetical protein
LQCECEQAADHAEHNSGDCHALARAPAAAPANLSERAAAEPNGGQTAQTREEEKGAERQARDHPSTCDRELGLEGEPLVVEQQRGLGYAELAPAVRATHALADVRLGGLELTTAVARQRNGHGSAPFCFGQSQSRQKPGNPS